MLNDDSFTSGGSLGSSMDLATTPDSPLSLTSKVYAHSQFVIWQQLVHLLCIDDLIRTLNHIARARASYVN